MKIRNPVNNFFFMDILYTIPFIPNLNYKSRYKIVIRTNRAITINDYIKHMV